MQNILIDADPKQPSQILVFLMLGTLTDKHMYFHTCTVIGKHPELPSMLVILIYVQKGKVLVNSGE